MHETPIREQANRFRQFTCSRFIEIDDHSVQLCCNFQGIKLHVTIRFKHCHILLYVNVISYSSVTKPPAARTDKLFLTSLGQPAHKLRLMAIIFLNLIFAFFHRGFFSPENLKQYMLLPNRNEEICFSVHQPHLDCNPDW